VLLSLSVLDLLFSFALLLFSESNPVLSRAAFELEVLCDLPLLLPSLALANLFDLPLDFPLIIFVPATAYNLRGSCAATEKGFQGGGLH
jgi:hypothetical protein